MIKKTIYSTIALAIFFGVCVGLNLMFESHKFNKNKKLLKSIQIVATGQQCKEPLQYEFKITNKTPYELNKVEFSVNGKIQGRSEKYNLGFDMNFASDFIQKPGSDNVGCLKLNQENWPKDETLVITAEVQRADLLIDGEVVGIPY